MLRIFWSEGSLNPCYILIPVFLLTLGVITSLVLMFGGTQALAEWASASRSPTPAPSSAPGMNYCGIAAPILLWLTVVFEIDSGPMRREESRAVSTGDLYDPDEQIPGQLTDSLPRTSRGRCAPSSSPSPSACGC